MSKQTNSVVRKGRLVEIAERITSIKARKAALDTERDKLVARLAAITDEHSRLTAEHSTLLRDLDKLSL